MNKKKKLLPQVSRRLTFVPASLALLQRQSIHFVPEAQLVVNMSLPFPVVILRKMTSLKWQEDNS